MPRNTGKVASRRKRKEFVKAAKGYFGARHRLYRTSREVVERAWQFSYKHRRTKKRDFRRLWIARINAAARLEGTTYSKFMHGLKQAGIELNRKAIANIAITDPSAFTKLARLSKENI